MPIAISKKSSDGTTAHSAVDNLALRISQLAMVNSSNPASVTLKVSVTSSPCCRPLPTACSRRPGAPSDARRPSARDGSRSARAEDATNRAAIGLHVTEAYRKLFASLLFGLCEGAMSRWRPVGDRMESRCLPMDPSTACRLRQLSGSGAPGGRPRRQPGSATTDHRSGCRPTSATRCKYDDRFCVALLSRSAEVKVSQRAGSMMASADVQNALVASAKVLVPASSATTARIR